MWSEARAAAARRELRALTEAPMTPAEVQQTAMDVVGTVVPSDAACWATVDPETLLLTGSVTVAFDATPEMEERFVEIELGGGDVHPFASLIEGPARAVRLSDAARHELDRSKRVNELWRPMGVRHELRSAFVSNGSCWGVAGIFRGGLSSDFDDREIAFVDSVAGTIADALRAAATRPASPEADGHMGPAVVIVGPDGVPRAATPAAQARLLAAEDGHASRRIALRSVVAAVRGGASSARARLRQPDGSWVVLHASPLDGDAAAGDVAVTVERADGRDLAGLLLKAHGLTERERAVCLQLLDGMSTKQISASLYISGHTVQDHLKSVFTKMGVRSRRELVARLHAL